MHCVFIDLEKVNKEYPPKKEMRQGGVPKCYVESIEDMCGGANGRLRSESRPTSGNGTQPIHVCHNHGRANERCRKRAP